MNNTLTKKMNVSFPIGSRLVLEMSHYAKPNAVNYKWDDVYAEGLRKLSDHYGVDMEAMISKLK